MLLLDQIRNKTYKGNLSDDDKNKLLKELISQVQARQLVAVTDFKNKDILKDPTAFKQSILELDFLTEVSFSVLEDSIKSKLSNYSKIKKKLDTQLKVGQETATNSKLYFEHNTLQQVFDVGGEFQTPSLSVYRILSSWFPKEDPMSLFCYYLYLRYDSKVMESIQAAYAFLKYKKNLK